MIEAIVLDLDDTLYLEREYVRSGFRFVASELGTSGLGDPVHLFKYLWADFEAGRRGGAFDALCEEFDFGEEVTVLDLVELYRGHSPAIQLSEPDVLDDLHDLMPLALITDGPEATQKAKIDALGLDDLFDPLLLTGAWGREFWKPHPRAFEAVEAQLGLSGSQLVYVGDNPGKDFETPNFRGWSTVRIRKGGQLHYDVDPPYEAAAPMHEVMSLAEFAEMLRSQGS